MHACNVNLRWLHVILVTVDCNDNDATDWRIGSYMVYYDLVITMD